MASFRNYPGALQLNVNMGPKAFLADLYEEAWVKQDLKSLFTPLDVVRDPNTPAYEIPKDPMMLSWKNKAINPPAIYVRDEYHAMLRDIVKYAVMGELRPGQKLKRGLLDEMDVGVDSEFIPFYNYIADVTDTPKAKGAIVIGTPGIGKTLFLYYALVFCLHARRPAIFQSKPGEMFVMNGEGIFRVPYPTSELDFLDYISPGTWFFVDSNHALLQPQEELFMWSDYCDGFILQAASPRDKRIDWVDKIEKVLPFWMSPWTLGELIAARDCQTWEGPRPSERDLATFIELFGGCARDAYLFSTNQAVFEEKLHSGRLRTLTRDQLKLLTDLACSHRLDNEGSHRLLMMYPGPYDRTVFNVQIPTKHLFELVLKALQRDDGRAPAFLYRLFIKNSRLRGNAKYFLQRAISAAFTKGAQWPMTIMQRSPGENVRWHLDKNAALLYLRLGYQGGLVETSDIDNGASSGQLTGLKSHVFNIAQEQDLFLEDGLYVPHSRVSPSFDPFVYDTKTKTATIFQIVVWKRQRIKHAELNWLQDHGPKTIDVVVVTPPLEKKEPDKYLFEIERKDRFDDVNVYVSLPYASAIRNVYHLAIQEVED